MELYDESYKQGAKKFKEASAELVEAYKKYQAMLAEKSPFENKTNELIMLAAACAIQCSYCIDTHSTRAKNAGATDEEISMVIHLAASVKHGATTSYGVNALAD